MSDQRPQLSYVFAATTSEEVHKVAAWLRTNRPAGAEIVLAAPSRVFADVAGPTIPLGVILASAPTAGGEDRKSVRVAGARVTTGLIVVAVDCDGDIAIRMQEQPDSLREAEAAEAAAAWSEVDLPRTNAPQLAPARRNR